MKNDGARLWLPPLNLAGCVRAGFLRDTRGLALQDAELDTYYPASPLVCLTWTFEGSAEWLASPGFVPPSAGFQVWPVALSGPVTGPTHLRVAPSGVHGLQLLFLPDAFRLLTGIDAASLVDRCVDAASLLPPDWCEWAASLAGLVDDEARLASLEAFLAPRWQPLRSQEGVGQRYSQWLEALAVRAAGSAAGRSLRSFERRIKAFTGLPMRELRAVSRGEQAFLAAVAGAEAPAWAQLAVEADYADQSHLCRETRRLTGFSPEELRRRMREELAFWPYRLWA
ncbi:helix-turn-helix transcriptional regulator [Pelomonas sp. V22]|uniref:helix-turn-helix domain-containing protein n=1 Tax=Pelomonas sp. V22 TaxID=2822139 RepID=UPI0024A82DF8|nr:helix-turn-helix domain-containing protein [Pelomonas sp. V22]MDI4634747.1 helix-turn-helix transcriptional regulator [Pelomonas sp. V22]